MKGNVFRYIVFFSADLSILYPFYQRIICSAGGPWKVPEVDVISCEARFFSFSVFPTCNSVRVIVFTVTRINYSRVLQVIEEWRNFTEFSFPPLCESGFSPLEHLSQYFQVPPRLLRSFVALSSEIFWPPPFPRSLFKSAKDPTCSGISHFGHSTSPPLKYLSPLSAPLSGEIKVPFFSPRGKGRFFYP